MRALGDVVCANAARCEQATPAHRTAQHVEQRLREVLPRSHGPDSVLRRLRKFRSTGTHEGSVRDTGDATCSTPSKSGQPGSGGHFESQEQSGSQANPTELVWRRNRLVWSARGRLVRQFTYDEEVQQACWAWIDMGEKRDVHEMAPSLANAKTEKSDISVHRGQSILDTHDAAASPAQFQFRRVPQQRAQTREQKRRQRALCVFLTRTLLLYFPETGLQHAVALPFGLCSVFPAHSGLFITRQKEAEDERRAQRAEAPSNQVDDGLDGRDEQPLATMFYLKCLFRDWTPVEKEAATLRSFNELDEQVIFVSTDDPRSTSNAPLLVTVSSVHRRVRVYSYDTAPQARKERLVARADESEPGRAADGGAVAHGNTSQRPTYTRSASSKADLTFQPSHASIGQGRPSQAPRPQARASQASLGHGRPSTRARLSSARVPSRARDSSQRVADDLAGLLNGGGLPGPGNGQASMLPDAIGTPFSAGGPAANTRLRRASQTQQAVEMSVAARTPYTHQRTTSRQLSSRMSTSRGRPSMTSTRQNELSAALDLDNESNAVPAISTQTQRQTLLPAAPLSRPESTSESGYLQERALVRLLREIPLETWDDADARLPRSKAFVTDNHLCVVIPQAKQMIVLRVEAGGGHAVSLHMPETQRSKAVLECNDACPVGDDLGVATLRADQNIVEWHCTFSAGAQTIEIDLSRAGGRAISLRRCGDYSVEVSSWLENTISTQEVVLFHPSTCKTTARLLNALRVALPPSSASDLVARWRRCRHAREPSTTSSDWDKLVQLLSPSTSATTAVGVSDRLLSCRAQRHYGHDTLFGTQHESKARQVDALDPLDVEDHPSSRNVLYIVHALAQDARLDTHASAQELPLLADLAARLAARCGSAEWVDYWARLFPEVWRKVESEFVRKLSPSSGALIAPFTVIGHANSIDMPQPPDAILLLYGQLSGRAGIQPEQLFAHQVTVPAARVRELLPNSTRLMRVFGAFSAPPPTSRGSASPSISRAAQVLQCIMQESVAPLELAGAIAPLAAPLFEALRLCQANPPEGLSREAFRLIERQDLAANLSSLDLYWPNSLLPTSFVLDSSVPKHAVSARLNPVAAMIFNKDLRLRDVLDMLQTRTRTSIMHPSVDNLSDAAIKEEILQVLQGTQERIKAASVGRGMLHVATHPYNPTVRWRVPKLCFDLHLVPTPNVEYEYVPPRNEGGELDWPEFHNGVASALEIAVRDVPLESGWIFGQHGSEVSPRDAGFLLGIGLLGQLGALGRVHVLKLLLPRTGGLAAVGLLLGLGTSLVGSGDPAARHLIATHLPAFQPQGAHNLNLTMLEQAAALLGMGFLFMGSDHAWTAKRMLDQIGSNEVRASPPQELESEAYSLSAAFGLGLVMLGKARRIGIRTRPDRLIVAELQRLMSGKLPSLFQDDDDRSKLEWRVDTATTSSPAAIALGLIYLKSDCREVADAVPFPRNGSDLERIRPDFLLTRMLARCLILWSSIRPSGDWIDSVLPPFLLKLLRSGHLSETAQLAVLNLRVGAAFALGIKFAGSHDPQAYSCLMKELRTTLEQVRLEPSTFFQKIRQAALRACVDLLGISAAMVMAASGDLELLKHLRVLHGRTNASYGSHMASHMALGLLFLGGGRFTLGASDSAVAAMVMAFYPCFPSSSSDNRVHPQACRHLWVLAVEPRMLVAQDIDTKQLLYLPVRVARKAKEDLLTTPAQLPPLDQIEEVACVSDLHWPTTLRVSRSAVDAQALLGRRCLFVKQRQALADGRIGGKQRKRNLRTLAEPKLWLYQRVLEGNDQYLSAIAAGQSHSSTIPLQLELVVPRRVANSARQSQVVRAARWDVELRENRLEGPAMRQTSASGDYVDVRPSEQQIASLRAYIQHLQSPVAPPPSETIEQLEIPPWRVLEELRKLIQDARSSSALDEAQLQHVLLDTLQQLMHVSSEMVDLVAELLLQATR